MTAWIRRQADQGTLVWFLVLAVAIEATFASEFFLTTRNFSTLSGQMAPLWLAALGQLAAILVGAIDLSVGATAKLAALITSGVMDDRASMALPAVAIALGVSAFVGVLNGLMIVRAKIDPLVATLITFTLLKGVSLAYTRTPIGGIPSELTRLSRTQLLGLPYSVWLTLVFTVLIGVLLARTRFGRRVYAVGGDDEVARRAGVSPGTVRMWMMILCSTMAGLAGIALAFRQGVGDPRAGDGLELLSIVAVVVGGVSIFGGRGRVLGVMGGVVFLTILRNAMNLQGVDPLLSGVISGVLIILAVVVFSRTEQ